MSYYIEYDQKISNTQNVGIHFPFLTLCFLVLFVVLVNTFWSDGRMILQRILIPGDPETTLDAVHTFLDALRFGEPLSDAAEAFCREILIGAGIG